MKNFKNKIVVLPTYKCRGAILIPDLGIEVSANSGTVIDEDADLKICILEGLYDGKLYYLRSPKFDEIPQHDSRIIDTTIAETKRALTILEGTWPAPDIEMREIDNHNEAIVYSNKQHIEATPEEIKEWEQGLNDISNSAKRDASRAKMKRIGIKIFNYVCASFLVGFLILVLLAVFQAYSQ